jgi:hypothetical protein
VPVYFMTELENSMKGRLFVKIGRSRNPLRRMANLQTGNRREIRMMGEIRTRSLAEDCRVESELHQQFEDKIDAGEWYVLTAEDVLSSLKRFSPIAYASVGPDPFEVVSYDNDAVPEYASAWLWADVDQYDFCPSCGWACGWTYSENWGGDVCLACGASERDYDQDEPY